MTRVPKYWNKAKKYLSKKDKILSKLIKSYESPSETILTTRRDIFYSLCKSIIGQQISVAAANSVFFKFKKKCKNKINAKTVSNLTFSQLKSCGLSRQKVLGIKSLAKQIIEKTFNPKLILKMTDEEAIDYLSNLRQIGRWSAEMILLFTYNRSNIWPIQVSFLGFPCTTGSKCIDYLIADKIVIPKKFQKFYSEKIIYLPDTYQPNEEIKKLSFDHKSKSSVGLPENKFIFCCFNAHQKINLKIFKIWMRILKERENSILWLLKDNELSENNLKREADNLGVDPERLVFAKKLEIDQHLSRLKFADLFLDTYPYGAHTTCSNALRMCLPVITLAGDSFASRVSASLLNSINLNELITNDLKSYEKLALNISNDKKLLNEIKNKIKLYSTKKNLFKPDIFTKNLEKSYKMIYENYLNDHNPKEIEL